MIREIKRKSGWFFIVALLLLATLTACDNESSDFSQQIEVGEVYLNTEFTENYAYRINYSFEFYVPNLIHGTLMHGGRLYFYYVDSVFPENDVDIDSYDADIEAFEPPTSTIIIESMYPDGTHVSRTEIADAGRFIHIAGFRITDEGNFALIFTDSHFERLSVESYLVYAEYTPQGTKLVRHEISEFVPSDVSSFYFVQAIFTENSIVLFATTDSGSIIYSLDNQLSISAHITLDTQPQAMLPMVQTQDGRLIIHYIEQVRNTSRSFLREFYSETATWGEVFPIYSTTIRALYPASTTTTFDFYLDDGIYLFGYNLEENEKTTILNWTESRTSAGTGSHLHFLDNGEFSILTDRGIFTDDRYVEHTILSRIDRADLPDYTVITLGGVDFSHNLYIRQHVMDFNRQSQTHQIEIVDYFPPGGDNIDWHAAYTRFSIDLMTGRAPDIIIGDRATMASLTNAGLLHDLYEFMDADPELNRSDFIPSILESLEAHDGSLPAIFYSFTISALATMADTVPNTDNWNFNEMLTLIEEAALTGATPIINSTQVELSAGAFVRRAMVAPDFDFIDLVENTVNLENEEFIRILEIAAANFPHVHAILDFNTWEAHARTLAGLDATSIAAGRMQRGEVLFHDTRLWQVSDFQVYQRLMGDDMVYVGWPSQSGNKHDVMLQQGLSISLTSNSPDEAWEFVRKFLLPDSNMDISAADSIFDLFFPLRIDILEDMISYAMTPRLRLDENGDEIEVPRNFQYVELVIPFTIPVYAMTEAEAERFRDIIANTAVRPVFDDTLIEILEEELSRFFAGNSSATDTARVLQSRIQIFLSERS